MLNYQRVLHFRFIPTTVSLCPCGAAQHPDSIGSDVFRVDPDAREVDPSKAPALEGPQPFLHAQHILQRMYTHTYTLPVYVYVYVYVYIYMCVCVCSLSLSRIHTYTYTLYNLYTHTYTHVLYYVYIYNMCVYSICMYMYMHVHVHMYIYMCICIWKLVFHQVHCLPEPISAFVFWWRFSCKCQHGA